uniref:Uncharacterized protein n=1 Tax=Arundo donax TaxID=35708 RepID=A0A0A9B6F9_ARUDO
MACVMFHAHQIIALHILNCIVSLFSTTKYVGKEQ